MLACPGAELMAEKFFGIFSLSVMPRKVHVSQHDEEIGSTWYTDTFKELRLRSITHPEDWQPSWGASWMLGYLSKIGSGMFLRALEPPGLCQSPTALNITAGHLPKAWCSHYFEAIKGPDK